LIHSIGAAGANSDSKGRLDRLEVAAYKLGYEQGVKGGTEEVTTYSFEEKPLTKEEKEKWAEKSKSGCADAWSAR
jgi:ribosome modulation factor